MFVRLNPQNMSRRLIISVVVVVILIIAVMYLKPVTTTENREKVALFTQPIRNPEQGVSSSTAGSSQTVATTRIPEMNKRSSTIAVTAQTVSVSEAPETRESQSTRSSKNATSPDSVTTPSPETITTPPPITITTPSSSITVATTSTGLPEGTIGRVALRGWDSGSFCDQLLHNTFSQLVPVCEATGHSEQSAIMCKRTPKSTRMVECTIKNVLIRPKKLYEGMVSDHIVKSEGIELLADDLVSCKSPNTNGVYRTTESNDHTTMMVQESVRRQPTLKSSDCQRWINETTFLFQGVNVHVYFEFLALYNAYKSIFDQGNIGPYKVLRIASGSFTYLFDEYEKLLFPGVEFVKDMTEETVCFKKLILPPRGFASLIFRCKMESDIRGQCFQCNGKGRPGTAIRSFRTHALNACSLDDSTSPITGYRNPKKITVILRKQYHRFPGDNPHKFTRVLSNSDELLTELKANFKVNIVSFHGEDLPMCEQMRMVHDADILIGVHGAGLVHSWWLQDNALLFEIEPFDQRSNPSFRMLTMLAGINYKSFPLSQSSLSQISLDVKNFISALDGTIKNGV